MKSLALIQYSPESVVLAKGAIIAKATVDQVLT
jgi:hypothetical protein